MTVLLKRNMNKRTLFSALLLAGFLTAGAAGFTRQQRFVTIPLTRPYANGPWLVRLEVIGPKIIRVEATAESAFPQKQSLIIVPQTLTTQYKVTEDGDNVYVSTNEVGARVSKSTGRVVFFDAAGREIAAENATAGKTLQAVHRPRKRDRRGQSEGACSTAPRLDLDLAVRQRRHARLLWAWTAPGQRTEHEGQERGPLSIQHEGVGAFCGEQPQLWYLVGRIQLLSFR